MTRKKKKSEPRSLSLEAFELIAQRFRALGDPTRLQLVHALFEEERTVQSLCAEVETSPANASKHLRVLAQEGILGRRKEGLYVFYRLEDPSVRKLCDLVCRALARRFDGAKRAIDG